MKIGISGASGHLGRAVVAELVDRAGRHDIVAISRTPASSRAGVEARAGDYDKPETLEAAYQGLDRLLLIPSAELRPGVRGRQISAAVDAAVKAGVSHVYLISATGTHEEAAPAIGEPYWTSEQYLIRHAPRWTIIRMNYYIETIIDEMKNAVAQGVVAGLGDERVAFVSRDDLAAATAGALATEGHAGWIYNITGPEVLSGEDRAAALSDVIGKSIPFAVITEDVLRGGLQQAGLPDFVVDAVADIKRDFLTGKYDIITTDVERLSGRKPTTLRNFLAEALK
ncbi:NAD(P)H-binding protein [Brucella tritici]|uniref:NAD(P)H-binding protein n=1 Tax=Brucella tritici TaxID=94626 RepID=A0A6L3Y6Z5_9HYPH|nr:NAD(P)H-binding protein [Brucella tritici]KAB2676384.1 NAD(P)H-binding protein [Brucella tritici]